MPVQEDLRTRLDQALEHAPLMAAVEFGRQIVQHDDRPLPAIGGMPLRLRQQATQRGELGLPSRQGRAFRQPGMTNPPVGPVRADRGITRGQVPIAR